MQNNLKPWREVWLLCEVIAITGRWQFCQEWIKERALTWWAFRALVLALSCFSSGLLWVPEVEETAEMRGESSARGW